LARPALLSNLGYKILALVIAIFLWGVAHGTSPEERGYDIPVVFRGVPEDLVITEQSADVVNIRVLGSRAALRNVRGDRLEYDVNVTGVKSGVADFEVDPGAIELPRGLQVVSRSPARLEVKFESRATKSLPVRPDVEGQPAEGFQIAGVEVQPPRVRVSGARSAVLRLQEVMTETLDVTGAVGPVERDLRLTLGSGSLWVEDTGSVTVRVEVEPVPEPEPPEPPPPAPQGRRRR
jgi:YbbR domain-containing protein